MQDDSESLDFIFTALKLIQSFVEKVSPQFLNIMLVFLTPFAAVSRWMANVDDNGVDSMD